MASKLLAAAPWLCTLTGGNIESCASPAGAEPPQSRSWSEKGMAPDTHDNCYLLVPGDQCAVHLHARVHDQRCLPGRRRQRGAGPRAPTPARARTRGCAPIAASFPPLPTGGAVRPATGRARPADTGIAVIGRASDWRAARGARACIRSGLVAGKVLQNGVERVRELQQDVEFIGMVALVEGIGLVTGISEVADGRAAAASTG